MTDRYEPAVSACIQRLIKPGMTFVDVGANLGVFTLLAARLGANVTAFEPVPANLEILRRNIALNRANVTVIPKAVSSLPGNATLYLSTDMGSHSLLGAPSESLGKSLTVEVVRLDSILNHIDLLKVDVEGLELQVLEGLGSMRPKVILEYNAERVRKAGLNGLQFIDRLHGMGYEIENLDDPSGLSPVLSGLDITVNLLCK